jgi:hypothetical protein
MPSFHIDLATRVADVDHKWVDNLLTRFPIPGVEHADRGTARRVSLNGVRLIALVSRLNRQLGLSVGSAVGLAQRVLASEGEVDLGPGIELRLDLRTFIADIDARVAEAAEVLVPVRRGRPPRRRS